MDSRYLFTALPMACFFAPLNAAVITLPTQTVTASALQENDLLSSYGNASTYSPESLANVISPRASYQDALALAGAYEGNSVSGSFSIRGVNQDSMQGVIGTASNPLINVFEDGLPLSTMTLRYLPPVMDGLSSMVVQRGAQTLTPQAASLAGALSLTNGLPDFTKSGLLRLEAGSDNTYKGYIEQSFTLLPDELALKMSYFHHESDGYTENDYARSGDFAATERDRFQSILLWHPGKNADQSISLSIIRDIASGNPIANSSITATTDLYDHSINVNTAPEYPADRTALALRGSIEIQDDLVLESVTGYQVMDFRQYFDFDGTPLLQWFVDGATDERRFTQSLSISDKVGRMQWQAGAYYENSTYDVSFSGVGLTPIPSGSPYDNGASEDVSVLAAYASFDWEFMQDFHCFGGARLQQENHELHSRSTFSILPEKLAKGSSDTGAFLPQLGFAWKPSDKQSVDLKLARGYRAGGVSYAPIVGATQSFDPEYSWDLELAGHISPISSVSLSAGIFHSWMDDQQVANNVLGGFPGIDTLVTNVASSRRYGMDMEAVWNPAAGLNLFGSLAWTHTEFGDLSINGINHDGQAFPNAPEFLATIGVDYKHESGFFAAMNYTWADSTYSQISDPDLTQLDHRSLLSARIGYQWEHATMYVFGSNLLDDEYDLYRADRTSAAMPLIGKSGPPRMLGIGAEVKW